MKNKIKEIGKEFDKEFPNERGVFAFDDPYNARRDAIKSFYKRKIMQLFNEAIPEEKGLDDHSIRSPREIGYNQAISDIKERINKNIKN